MGNSLFDDMMSGAIVAKHLFRGASKAIAKTVEFAESEKGQQLKAELRAKTSEAVEFATAKTSEAVEFAIDKAREMGLEEKTKTILKYAKEYAKDVITNTSSEIPADVKAAIYAPGGYAERIETLENRIAEETAKHNQLIAELNEKLANAPESIEPDENGFYPDVLPDTANVFEAEIQDEQERFESTIYNLQEEIRNLKEELEEGLFFEQQRRREEEAYEEELEKERRRKEDALDWARFLGKDPEEY